MLFLCCLLNSFGQVQLLKSKIRNTHPSPPSLSVIPRIIRPSFSERSSLEKPDGGDAGYSKCRHDKVCGRLAHHVDARADQNGGGQFADHFDRAQEGEVGGPEAPGQGLRHAHHHGEDHGGDHAAHQVERQHARDSEINVLWATKKSCISDAYEGSR